MQFDPIALLAKASEGRAAASYASGQVIFAQGDPADAVFYVQTGRVKLTIVSGQGKEAVVGIYSASDFFGEASLAGQPLRIATATAMSECLIVRLAKSAMIRMLHDELAFSEFFVAHLLSRNIGSKRTWWTSFSTKARNAWHGCCCCWPISARKASRKRSSRTSLRRRWRR